MSFYLLKISILPLILKFAGDMQYYCCTIIISNNCTKNNLLWQANADMMFGGVTVVCGILGSLGGGFLLDYMNSTISNAFKVGIRIQRVNSSISFVQVYMHCLNCTA